MAGLNQLHSIFSDYNDNRKIAAWNNATLIPNSRDRMDCDGRVMCWSEYGLKSSFGWEIDHAIPTRLGGPDIVSNLRARHWQGNRSAGGILGNALRNMGRQRR